MSNILFERPVASRFQYDNKKIVDNTNNSFNYLEESKQQDDNKLKYPFTVFNVKNAVKKDTYKWLLESGKEEEGG